MKFSFQKSTYKNGHIRYYLLVNGKRVKGNKYQSCWFFCKNRYSNENCFYGNVIGMTFKSNSLTDTKKEMVEFYLKTIGKI